jgi:hypothetical protein
MPMLPNFHLAAKLWASSITVVCGIRIHDANRALMCGFFEYFIQHYFLSLFKIPLSRRMLGSNPWQLRLRPLLSHALTSARSHPHGNWFHYHPKPSANEYMKKKSLSAAQRDGKTKREEWRSPLWHYISAAVLAYGGGEQSQLKHKKVWLS